MRKECLYRSTLIIAAELDIDDREGRKESIEEGRKGGAGNHYSRY
jgi:hypothetical protein